MAKKRISNSDLSWMILEELREAGVSPVGLAIVSGHNKDDWRVVVDARSRSYLGKDGERQLAAIEEKLRRVYALAD